MRVQAKGREAARRATATAAGCVEEAGTSQRLPVGTVASATLVQDDRVEYSGCSQRCRHRHVEAFVVSTAAHSMGCVALTLLFLPLLPRGAFIVQPTNVVTTTLIHS